MEGDMHKIERAEWQLAYCNLGVYLIACALTTVFGSVEAIAMIA